METLSVRPQDRPTLLTVLCILTFIGSGFSVLANLTALIAVPFLDLFQPSMFNATFSQLGNNAGDEFIKQALDMVLLVIDNFFAIVFSKFILYALSLAGAIMMFQMKKIGFYLYIVAQVGFLFIGPVFLGWNMFVGSAIFFSAFFSVLFIALYGINLKNMS
ncbi:hypothetical protein [Ancylomarina sp. 16SWW S1-10-2]|uniref:hypothetical protein n=1 Tax=Ancylomarina sp. 16SWW S1-10-2 TaxID=2499681 RepID=UPI0012AD5EA3|nr:hypothetical protein [Ancylomarina sp. 16SWW S1-10-2]MRT93106.1 hypothetical protein [Ancylomarina sp. 16SWW S1-10-2]